MKRALVLLLLVGGCSQKDKVKVAASDPKFEAEWSLLAKSGAEPLFIEGDLHGSGLMGEVRRAVEPSTDMMLQKSGPLQGPLPDPEVVRVIRANLSAVKGCYAVEERKGIGSGKAIVSIEIDPSGAVSTVRVDAPAFADFDLPTCVGARARGWTFPKFTQGPKKFSYPFVFVGS